MFLQFFQKRFPIEKTSKSGIFSARDNRRVEIPLEGSLINSSQISAEEFRSRVIFLCIQVAKESQKKGQSGN